MIFMYIEVDNHYFSDERMNDSLSLPNMVCKVSPNSFHNVISTVLLSYCSRLYKTKAHVIIFFIIFQVYKKSTGALIYSGGISPQHMQTFYPTHGLQFKKFSYCLDLPQSLVSDDLTYKYWQLLEVHNICRSLKHPSENL